MAAASSRGSLPLRSGAIAPTIALLGPTRPYKKNEQAFIESFNRTVRKECLGWAHYQPHQLPALQTRVEDFFNRYHHH